MAATSTFERNVNWLIGLAVIGFAILWYESSKTERDAKQAASHARQVHDKEVQATLSALASRFGANTTWQKELDDAETKRHDEPILTMQLEKIWLGRGPLLFVGGIKDIRSLNESAYEVVIERDIYGWSRYDFSSSLRLSLRAPRALVDELLRLHPNASDRQCCDSAVAAIAKLDSVASVSEPPTGDDSVDVKVGSGELLDIAYIGNYP